jgi:hypothetical protein
MYMQHMQDDRESLRVARVTRVAQGNNGFLIYLLARKSVWIADAHRGNGQRFVVHANEKLTAFLELESAINQSKILAAALEAGLMEQEQHYPCSAVLP